MRSRQSSLFVESSDWIMLAYWYLRRSWPTGEREAFLITLTSRTAFNIFTMSSSRLSFCEPSASYLCLLYSCTIFIVFTDLKQIHDTNPCTKSIPEYRNNPRLTILLIKCPLALSSISLFDFMLWRINFSLLCSTCVNNSLLTLFSSTCLSHSSAPFSQHLQRPTQYFDTSRHRR